MQVSRYGPESSLVQHSADMTFGKNRGCFSSVCLGTRLCIFMHHLCRRLLGWQMKKNQGGSRRRLLAGVAEMLQVFHARSLTLIHLKSIKQPTEDLQIHSYETTASTRPVSQLRGVANSSLCLCSFCALLAPDPRRRLSSPPCAGFRLQASWAAASTQMRRGTAQHAVLASPSFSSTYSHAIETQGSDEAAWERQTRRHFCSMDKLLFLLFDNHP